MAVSKSSSTVPGPSIWPHVNCRHPTRLEASRGVFRRASVCEGLLHRRGVTPKPVDRPWGLSGGVCSKASGSPGKLFGRFVRTFTLKPGSAPLSGKTNRATAQATDLLRLFWFTSQIRFDPDRMLKRPARYRSRPWRSLSQRRKGLLLIQLHSAVLGHRGLVPKIPRAALDSNGVKASRSFDVSDTSPPQSVGILSQLMKNQMSWAEAKRGGSPWESRTGREGSASP